MRKPNSVLQRKLTFPWATFISLISCEISPLLTMRFTREVVSGPLTHLFYLAPNWVYQAADVAINAVGSYPAFSPLPLRAVCFLWHCSSAIITIVALFFKRNSALWCPDFPLAIIASRANVLRTLKACFLFCATGTLLTTKKTLPLPTRFSKMVVANRLELSTSTMWMLRSNQLSYATILNW